MRAGSAQEIQEKEKREASMADFDVIVVGAGIAGCTAAYKLASEGAEVLLVERAARPGSKNLSGGIFYGRVLPDLIPDFYEEAPIERRIVRNVVTFLGQDCAVNIDHADRSFAGNGQCPPNGFSVLRASFDNWLAEKAEEAGAVLVPGIRVDSLILEGNRCKGIVADGEEMTAECVIVADGINSTLSEALGQRSGFDIHAMGVGVKYLYELGEEEINRRFRCHAGEGVAYGILGDATEGIPGGGFVYTNRDTVSVGLVMHIDHLAESWKTPYDLLERFVENPEIASLVEGGKLIEYGAHMVAEGGAVNLPKSLYGDGWMIVGDAAGFAANNGFTVRGMDFAAKSGLLAAQAALEAKATGDWSAAALSRYEKLVNDSFIGADMKTYGKAPVLMKDGRLYTNMVSLATGLFSDLYGQNSVPKQNLAQIAKSNLKTSGVGMKGVASIGWKAVKSL